MQLEGRRGSGTQKERWMERFERDSRLLSALDDLLVPQEAVEIVAYGVSGSAVVGTPAGVLVFKRGLRAGIPFGHRLKPFEFESVMALNVRRVTEGVVLAVHAPLRFGSCLVYWLGERDDPWRARNAIVAEDDGDLEAFESVAAELRRLMNAHHARHGRVTPPAEPRIEPVRSAPELQRCASCGAEAAAGWHYCPECGTPVVSVPDGWPWPRATHGAGR